MKKYKVTHKTFGLGEVSGIQGDHITVEFSDSTKTFVAKMFDNFFTYDDAELKAIISAACPKQAPASSSVHATTTASVPHAAVKPSPYISNGASALIGPRSQSLPISSQEQLFEIIGYMARPGRINSIEAEVPKDGRDTVFESLFPGQVYRPIELGYTPSGMPNKVSPQFRINFGSLRNCPPILKSNMGSGNGSCVGRINKSRFVIDIVQNYGFRFGSTQDIAKIRRIAAEKNYLDAFEKGYSL